MKRSTQLMLGAAAVAFSPAKAALAQEAAGASAAPDQNSEIVVTAQRREERLVDVPLSISVLSGEDLDSATTPNLREALNNVPGVFTDVSYNGTAGRITVRGVGAGQYEGGSGVVGFYLDSAPFGSVKNALTPDLAPYDLDRVEVLRGPQGSLYGAG